MTTSGVFSGRSPKRSALKSCRSVKRPIPVSLSGVRLRGRVVKHPFAAGSTPHGGGPILKSTGGSDAPRPARKPLAAGLLPPP